MTNPILEHLFRSVQMPVAYFYGVTLLLLLFGIVTYNLIGVLGVGLAEFPECKRELGLLRHNCLLACEQQQLDFLSVSGRINPLLPINISQDNRTVQPNTEVNK